MLEGVRLMAIGMSTVIGFLTLLVLCMHTAALLFKRFPEERVASGEDNELQADDSERARLAVVLAAVAVHRTHHSEG